MTQLYIMYIMYECMYVVPIHLYLKKRGFWFGLEHLESRLRQNLTQKSQEIPTQTRPKTSAQKSQKPENFSQKNQKLKFLGWDFRVKFCRYYYVYHHQIALSLRFGDTLASHWWKLKTIKKGLTLSLAVHPTVAASVSRSRKPWWPSTNNCLASPFAAQQQQPLLSEPQHQPSARSVYSKPKISMA